VRVLYVWDADYPWDVRTEKICLTLAQHSHHVVIAARNREGKPRREALPEGIVERLPAFRVPGGGFLSFPAFFNPVWLRHLSRLGVRHRIDIVIVRDLPLAPAALLASRGRWPVVLDMAENYPAMIADIWTDGRAGPLDVLVRNPRIVAAVERFTVRHAAHILTVVEESKERVERLGVPAHRVSVVSNTPPISRVAPLAPRMSGEPLRIVYLGLIEKHRGVEELLLAARELAAAGVEFALDMVGDGKDYGYMRRRAADLRLTAPRVVFHGRLPHGNAIAILRRAHVGVVPHHARESWNTTIPNKLFDYMAAGLAVVSSDAAPAARIIRETGAGLLFDSGDATDLAQKLRQLRDLSVWDRYRRSGQEAVLSRYNWESETRVLLEVVSGTAGGMMRRDWHRHSLEFRDRV
jgi:glycosyltransferase involved in cell wall biosynthesis